MGRPRRARHTPARRRPTLARPGVMVGATLNADARLGGRRRHAAHAPAARRLTMSRASRRSLKLIVQPAHPLPPEEGLSSGCASGSRDGWAGGPQAQVPPILEGAGACYGLFPPSPATIVLRAPGRRLIKQSGAPLCRRSSQGVI
jgi:hypothetical protein